MTELLSILKDLNNGHTHIVDDESLFAMLKDVYGAMGWYDFFDDSKVINRYESLKGKNTSLNNQLGGKELILKVGIKEILRYKKIEVFLRGCRATSTAFFL